MEGNHFDPTHDQHIFPHPMPCFTQNNQVYDENYLPPLQHLQYNNINTSLLLDAGIGIAMTTPNTYQSLPSSPIQPHTPITPIYPSFPPDYPNDHNQMVNWPPIDPLMLPHHPTRFIPVSNPNAIPVPPTLGRSASLSQLDTHTHNHNHNHNHNLFNPQSVFNNRRVSSNPLPLTQAYSQNGTQGNGHTVHGMGMNGGTINPALITPTNAWQESLARQGVLYRGDTSIDGRKIWSQEQEEEEEEDEEGEEEGGEIGVSRFENEDTIGRQMGLGLSLGFNSGWGNGGEVGLGLSESWSGGGGKVAGPQPTSGGVVSEKVNVEACENGTIAQGKIVIVGNSSVSQAKQETPTAPRSNENHETKLPTSTCTSTNTTTPPTKNTLEVTITPTKSSAYNPDPDPLTIPTSCIRGTRSIDSSTQSTQSDKSEISPSAFATGKYDDDYEQDTDYQPRKSLRSRSSRVNPKSRYNTDATFIPEKSLKSMPEKPKPKLTKRSTSTSLKREKGQQGKVDVEVEGYVDDLREVTDVEADWAKSALKEVEPGDGILTHDILDAKRVRRGFGLYHHEKILVILADGRFEEYIHWDEDGEEIIIPNEHAFAKNVAGKFWKTDIWDSFTRSCAMSGISHREEGTNHHALSHPRLRQSDAYLWHLVRRLPTFDLSKTLSDQPKPKSATKLQNENTQLRNLLQNCMRWTNADIDRELSSGISSLYVDGQHESRDKRSEIESTSSTPSPGETTISSFDPSSGNSEETTPTKAYPKTRKSAKVPPYHSPAQVVFTTPACNAFTGGEDDNSLGMGDASGGGSEGGVGGKSGGGGVKSGLRKRKSVRALGGESAGETEDEGDEGGDECSQGVIGEKRGKDKGKGDKKQNRKEKEKEVLVDGKVVKRGLKQKKSRTE